MRQLERVAASAAINEMLGAYERDGGLIVEGMVPRPVVDDLRSAFDEFSASVEPRSATQGQGEDGKAFTGAYTVRFSSLGLITPAFFELLENEVFGQLANAVLLPHCGSYWLNTGQVMYINPGESAQVLHRDANNWWPYMRATWPNSVEITISAIVALDRVTEEMGATRVVPGSHVWPTLDRWTQHESVPAELEAGDALVYSGRVLHGGGANQTTNTVRRAVHFSFVAGWLTPEEASPLDFKPGDLADKSSRLQRLLGHRSYDPRPHRGGGLWLRHVKAIEDN